MNISKISKVKVICPNCRDNFFYELKIKPRLEYISYDITCPICGRCFSQKQIVDPIEAYNKAVQELNRNAKEQHFEIVPQLTESFILDAKENK